MTLRALLLWLIFSTASHADVTRDQMIALARAGWSYELRTTMRRPGSAELMPVLHARSMIGAELCLLGEAPSAASLAVLTEMQRLLHQVFGAAFDLRSAGRVEDCGPGASVFLRLYSTRDPTLALNADLDALNRRYDFGLTRAAQLPGSPGQAQTLFGKRGMATHLLVMQDGAGGVPAAQSGHYRTLLIEELFQSLTFGMDILHLDRAAPLLSKLEEVPNRAAFLPWRSDAFIAQMAQSGTAGLCAFDVLMLVALAESDLERSNDPAFIDEIAARFDRYERRATEVMADPALSGLFDPVCAVLPGD